MNHNAIRVVVATCNRLKTIASKQYTAGSGEIV